MADRDWSYWGWAALAAVYAVVLAALLVHLFYVPGVRPDGPARGPRSLREPPAVAAERPPSRKILVTAAAYNCVREQTDSNPMVTASGMRCGYPVLAVSQDLLRELPFGTRVRVYGSRYVVGDTMHHRWRRRIDVPMSTRGEAMRHGVRRGVILEVLP